jgi:hypothetical protein
MSSSTPLQGLDLIDCAKANYPAGIEIAAKQCGYGDNVATFESQLRQAFHAIGVDLRDFRDLADVKQLSNRGSI